VGVLERERETCRRTCVRGGKKPFWFNWFFLGWARKRRGVLNLTRVEGRKIGGAHHVRGQPIIVAFCSVVLVSRADFTRHVRIRYRFLRQSIHFCVRAAPVSHKFSTFLRDRVNSTRNIKGGQGGSTTFDSLRFSLLEIHTMHLIYMQI
jgi:hypothetical protein